MYSEKKFKNYIFWIQVKRVVLIILFSLVGAGIGIAIGAVLKGTINIDTYNNLIIIFLTVIFFLLSLLVTSGTGKEVQDGYWKIAVLRKLTAIQKTIEVNNELIQKNENLESQLMNSIAERNKEIEKIISNNVSVKNDITKSKPDVGEEKKADELKEEKKPSLKKKKIKKPEVV